MTLFIYKYVIVLLTLSFLQIDHLHKGELAALARIQNHHTILDEISVLKRKLKSTEAKVVDLGNANSFLLIQDKKHAADIGCKELQIRELEEKNRKMQVEHTNAITAKSYAEAQVALQKSLVDSLNISLAEANLSITQLKGERDILKSDPSVADLLIKYDEQTEELNNLRCKYDDLRIKFAKNEEYLQSELRKNIDDYNNLVQY